MAGLSVWVPPESVVTNLAPNPRAALDTGSVSTAGTTLTRLTGQAWATGGTAFRMTAGGAGTQYARVAPSIPAAPGDVVSARTLQRGNAGAFTRLAIQFLDSTGTQIVMNTGSTVAVHTGAGTAAELTNLNRVAPAGTAECRVYQYVFSTSGGGVATAGQVVEFSEVLIEKAATLGGYFDGDSAGARWTGTPHASASELGIGVDTDPCPRVEIVVDGLHASTPSTVTVWRTSGGQRMKVRGADGVQATAAFFVVDYEAPLGRHVDYTAEVVGPTVPAALADSVTVASDVAWIQDPLSPTQASPLAPEWLTSQGAVISGYAMTSLTYPMPVELVAPLGSGLPVALGGARVGAARVPMDLFSDTTEATERIRSILTTAFPVLLRTAPGMEPLPPVCFLSIADVVEQPVTALIGGSLTQWGLTADLVAGPAISVVVPVWTYADVAALWSTYAQVVATGRRYLDMLRNPEP